MQGERYETGNEPKRFLGRACRRRTPGAAAAPAAAPTAPVAIAKCKTYAEYLPVMEKMIDQIGGLGRLVKGKTVAIKINFTGGPTTRLGFLPQSRTYWTHPHTVGAMIHLLNKAGARRIRVAEGAAWRGPHSLEEWMYQASWDIGRCERGAEGGVCQHQPALPWQQALHPV